MSEETKKAVLYDVDASQVLRLNVPGEQEVFEVEFQFKPFTNEQLLEYLAEKDDDDATSTRALFGALLNSHNVEGEDDTLLSNEDLCELLEASTLRKAIEDGLLGSEFLPLPKAEGKRLKLFKGERYSTWPLAVKFNGEQVATTHRLRRPTNEERQEYFKLFTLNRFVGRELCRLYDRLKVATTGYVDGSKVPVNHKLAVVVQHFTSHEEVLVGKLTPAPPA